MKIILHLGAHKTASTHLQYNFRLNEKHLEQNKIKYLSFHKTGTLRSDSIKLRRNLNDESLVNKLTSSIRQQILKEIENFDVAIISYEGILGELNQYDQDKIYAAVEKLARIYREILAGHEIVPVFAIRNYHNFMVSSYKFCLQYYDIHLSLNDYLKNKNIPNNRWTSIITTLEKTFGHPPQIFTQEEYREKWKDIIFEIIKISGKEIKFNDLTFDAQSKNESKTPAYLNYFYTRNLLMKASPKFIGKGRLRMFLNKNSSLWTSMPISSLLLKYKKGEIEPINQLEEYKKEVAILTEKYGIL